MSFDLSQIVVLVIFSVMWGVLFWFIKRDKQDTIDRIHCLENENKKQFNIIGELKGEIQQVRDKQWGENKLREVVTGAVNAAFDKNAREWLENGWLHQHTKRDNAKNSGVSQ